MKEINFCSLSSGSSGNCYYLGNESGGVLIDAGISASAIRKFLNQIGISMQSIMGILLSHNHTDHTRGLEVLTRKYNIPAFTTDKVWESIIARNNKISRDCIRTVSLQEEFQLAGFNIEVFPVSHDAPATIGFHFRAGKKKITIATDLGYISELVSPYLKAANILVIESNYDEQMLAEGRYPSFLKKRISSDHGHLSNHQTSTFLADNINGKLSHICLAHLSKNNNTPEKALQILETILNERGNSLNGQPQISVLSRHKPSDVIRLSD